MQREARNHFDCPTLNGLELENLGGDGTQYSHWKKRLVEVSFQKRCLHRYKLTGMLRKFLTGLWKAIIYSFIRGLMGNLPPMLIIQAGTMCVHVLIYSDIYLPLLVQNEGMTGVISTNGVFSRLTFALYEDSG